MSERAWDRRRERGREDHERERERRERKQSERARAPCLGFQCFGLARRLNLSCTVKSVGRLRGSRTTRYERTVVTSFGLRVKRERGARETNERKHRSKHATSETEREREERLYGDALGTDELYAYDRETEQWGYREGHISRRFAGYVRDTTTTRPACVPAREGTSNSLLLHRVIVANQHSREKIGEYATSGRGNDRRNQTDDELLPSPGAVSFESPFFFFFKRVYVIVERELRCRRVTTFAAIFIVPVEVASFFVAVSPHTYHDPCPLDRRHRKGTNRSASFVR